MGDGEVISGTAVESPVSEVTTGTWGQYHSWATTITLDFDVATPNNLASQDCLNLRIYRIAASSAEIAGEVVVTGTAIRWQMNKLYSSS